MIIKELIPNIASGFELEVGSVVLLQFWGENEDLDVLDNFALEIAKMGCIPIKWQYSREFLKTYFEGTPEKYLSFPDKYFSMFKFCDAVIDICMYTPPKPHPDFPKDKIPFYRDYMINLMNSMTDKEIFIQVKLPTKSNAEASGMIDFNSYEAAVIKAMSVNYNELKTRTRELHKTLEGSKTVEIQTKDKALLMSVDNRSWFKDDGNGDLPAGEVYIAPIEDSAYGQIHIPFAFVNGVEYKDLDMSFEKGRLVECSSQQLLEMLRSIHPDSMVLAELGIGLNDKVTELIGYATLDEKCLGTAHIALGMNTMFGGKNSCPVHFDFVFTPSNFLVDGEKIM